MVLGSFLSLCIVTEMTLLYLTLLMIIFGSSGYIVVYGRPALAWRWVPTPPPPSQEWGRFGGHFEVLVKSAENEIKASNLV